MYINVLLYLKTLQCYLSGLSTKQQHEQNPNRQERTVLLKMSQREVDGAREGEKEEYKDGAGGGKRRRTRRRRTRTRNTT